jgi:hypothetical protein
MLACPTRVDSPGRWIDHERMVDPAHYSSDEQCTQCTKFR